MRYIITVFILSAISIFLLTIFRPIIHNQASIISPIPDFLTLDNNKQLTSLDFWLPFLNSSEIDSYNSPQITAKSALIYDLNTRKIIYEKDSRTKLPMASITKIMTAIVALESDKKEKYFVSENNLVGENSMGLEAGEILNREELLYGLLLPSGNDAAEVLASNYPDGGRSGFIKAMNSKAQVIGLTDTRFSNPSGLQGDGDQYTTAYDLLVITKYALDNFPEFSKIVSTYDKEITENKTHKTYYLYNETNLLSTYPGVKGVKTGYTPEAGYCLVTYLEYKNAKIIGIILNSENRRAEMKQLLDYSLDKISITPPIFKG